MSHSMTMDVPTATGSAYDAMSTAMDHDMDAMDMMGGCKISVSAF